MTITPSLIRAAMELIGQELSCQAGDDSPFALAAAQHNASRLRNIWCTCRPEPEQVYFRKPSGSHGWMCTQCHGITQAG